MVELFDHTRSDPEDQVMSRSETFKWIKCNKNYNTNKTKIKVSWADVLTGLKLLGKDRNKANYIFLVWKF